MKEKLPAPQVDAVTAVPAYTLPAILLVDIPPGSRGPANVTVLNIGTSTVYLRWDRPASAISGPVGASNHGIELASQVGFTDDAPPVGRLIASSADSGTGSVSVHAAWSNPE